VSGRWAAEAADSQVPEPDVEPAVPHHPQGAPGDLDHHPRARSDRGDQHPQGVGCRDPRHPQARQRQVTAGPCPTPPLGAGRGVGEQHCAAATSPCSAGDCRRDGVPEPGVLRPLARALLAVAAETHAARCDPLGAASRAATPTCGWARRALLSVVVSPAIRAATGPPLLSGPGLRSRTRTSKPLEGRQWSTPTLWVVVHDFFASLTAAARAGAGHRRTVDGGCVLAHREGQGDPPPHLPASGAHHQPGACHVLRRSQHRPAPAEPALRPPPGRAVQAPACQANRRVPLRARPPRRLRRRRDGQGTTSTPR
jgi:hypothetical protein